MITWKRTKGNGLRSSTRSWKDDTDLAIDDIHDGAYLEDIEDGKNSGVTVERGLMPTKGEYDDGY